MINNRELFEFIKSKITKIRTSQCNSKQGKASGPDNMYIEVIKLLNDDTLKVLVKILNNIYETSEIP